MKDPTTVRGMQLLHSKKGLVTGAFFGYYPNMQVGANQRAELAIKARSAITSMCAIAGVRGDDAERLAFIASRCVELAVPHITDTVRGFSVMVNFAWTVDNPGCGGQHIGDGKTAESQFNLSGCVSEDGRGFPETHVSCGSGFRYQGKARKNGVILLHTATRRVLAYELDESYQPAYAPALFKGERK